MTKRKSTSSTKSKPKTTKKKSRKYDEFITFVLLHGQSIQRLKKNEPACFAKIGRQFLIDRQIAAIDRKFNNYEIIVSLGYCSDVLHEHISKNHSSKAIRIVENINYETTNSCETARLCINNISNDRICFMYGNLFFESKIFDGCDFYNSFAMLNDQEEESLEVRVNTNDHIIKFFCYGASKPWCEIVFINGKNIVYDLHRVLKTKSFRKKFFFEAMNEVIRTHIISGKINKRNVAKIKNIKTYNKIRSQYEIRN